MQGYALARRGTCRACDVQANFRPMGLSKPIEAPSTAKLYGIEIGLLSIRDFLIPEYQLQRYTYMP